MQRKFTREELEAAISETAWAYYLKGDKLQYDSQQLSVVADKYHGGRFRVTDDATPEDATSDEVAYAVCTDYIYKLYLNVLNKRIIDAVHNLDVVTKALWTYSDYFGITVLRWWRNDYQLTEDELRYGVTEKYRVSEEECKDFLRNWKENLRPGDILMPKGHATMYIGNGYVIDANGLKYNLETGMETKEPYGTVHKLRKISDIFLDGTDVGRESCRVGENGVRSYFLVCRPLDQMMKDPDLTITPSGLSRLKYPGMEIDRTVDISPYGTASHMGEITYRVQISNKSDHPVYSQFRRDADPAFAPVDYVQLPVTETVPAGTELVWAPGAVVTGNQLSWKLDIPAGKVQTVFYTVRVTASVGSYITNNGGFVDQIPSNTLVNQVGQSKFQEKRFEKSQLLEYVRRCNATGTAFAADVYARLLDRTLELPNVDALCNTIVQKTDVKKRCILRDTHVLKGKFLTDTSREITVKAWLLTGHHPMMIRNYVGGKLTEVGEMKPINDFRTRYLEQGDIVVYWNETGKNRVLVYLGEDTLLAMSSGGTAEVLYGVDAENALWQALSWDVFFALRPRNAEK